jgi:hypothetical protein
LEVEEQLNIYISILKTRDIPQAEEKRFRNYIEIERK